MEPPLLHIEGLDVELRTGDRRARVVERLDLQVERAGAVGLVGESGCGKSLSALAVLRLLPRPAAAVTSGRILFEGRDLLALPAAEMRRVRGAGIGMIFQEPTTSLHPVYRCGEQVAEVLRTHLGMGRREADERAVELLREVRIDRPEQRARQLPHELSGGMRQRVMIAIALAAGPRLVLADEPTTALDVTVQRQILDLLDALRRQRRTGLLLITHDLALVAGRTERVAVMYAGRVVESGPTGELFRRPAHPYTLGLLACRPRLGTRRARLASIGGQVPGVFERPGGCAFHPRCPFAQDRCARERPEVRDLGGGRRVACHEVETVLAAEEWPA